MKDLNHVLVAPVIVAAVLGSAAVSAAPVKPPAEPAKIRIEVEPDGVAPGGSARVTVHLAPIAGVKINRYPQVELRVPEKDGLHGEAKASLGDETPPPLEQMAKNYFKRMDPLELAIEVSDSAPKGEHRVEGQLKYFYCVTKSGFCAPARVPVTFPLTVR